MCEEGRFVCSELGKGAAGNISSELLMCSGGVRCIFCCLLWLDT